MNLLVYLPANSIGTFNLSQCLPFMQYASESQWTVADIETCTQVCVYSVIYHYVWRNDEWTRCEIKIKRYFIKISVTASSEEQWGGVEHWTLSACHPLEEIWAVDSQTDSSWDVSHKSDKEITRWKKKKKKKMKKITACLPTQAWMLFNGPIYTQNSFL